MAKPPSAFPLSSVQIPWANTRIDTEYERDHIAEAAEGKTADLIVETPLYRILLPYTSTAFLSLGQYHWSEDKFRAAARHNGFSYIVHYTDTDTSPTYAMALLTVIGDATYIQDDAGRARIAGQFVNDFVVDKARPNQDILTVVARDAKSRKTPYLQQVSQEKNSNSLLKIIEADPTHIKDVVLHNENLSVETLRELARIAVKTDHTDQLKFIFNHHNVDDGVFYAAMQSADPADKQTFAYIAASHHASTIVLNALVARKNKLDRYEILALVLNEHTSGEVLEKILNTYHASMPESLLTLLLLHRNLPPMLLQNYKNHPALGDVARKTLLSRMFQTK